MKRVSAAIIAAFLWTMLLPLVGNAAEIAAVKPLPAPCFAFPRTGVFLCES